ncbi:MAG: hypothetical protein QM653_02770 [Dysgonomonas sp.]|uniref:hypothetical protein n=1 Tax=Dysgonomonas sp. TaxID=1891233 RepID=UPI0039E66FEC
MEKFEIEIRKVSNGYILSFEENSAVANTKEEASTWLTKLLTAPLPDDINETTTIEIIVKK